MKHVTMSRSLSNFCESKLNRLASPQSSTCDETQMTKPSTSTQWWWGQSELYLFVDVPLLAVKEAATSALGAFTHNRALFFFLLAPDTLQMQRAISRSQSHEVLNDVRPSSQSYPASGRYGDLTTSPYHTYLEVPPNALQGYLHKAQTILSRLTRVSTSTTSAASHCDRITHHFG